MPDSPAAIDTDTLVARFRAGDADAFRQLHTQYGGMLLAFLRQRCRGKLDANDVSQDIWLRVWKARGRYEHQNFGAWLYQIARNRLVDLYRSDGSRPKTDALTGDISFAEESPAATDDRVEALRECLDTVGGDFVKVWRRRLQGASDREIAKEMNIAVGTVYTRANRCKQEIREGVEQKLQ